MARLPYLDRSDLLPEHQDLLARNLNLYRVLAHSPRAARSLNTGNQRSAISANRHIHNARAFAAGDLLRAIGRAIVSDDHFAAEPGIADRSKRLADAEGQRLGLIEARHQDGQIELGHVEMVLGSKA